MRRDLLPVTQLPAWCLLNGPSLVNAAVVDDMKSNGGASKGAGLVALRAALGDGTHNSVLMTVPSDLILSKERVEQMAKYDTHLREVLHAVETFAEVGIRSLSLESPCPSDCICAETPTRHFDLSSHPNQPFLSRPRQGPRWSHVPLH